MREGRCKFPVTKTVNGVKEFGGTLTTVFEPYTSRCRHHLRKVTVGMDPAKSGMYQPTLYVDARFMVDENSILGTLGALEAAFGWMPLTINDRQNVAYALYIEEDEPYNIKGCSEGLSVFLAAMCRVPENFAATGCIRGFFSSGMPVQLPVSTVDCVDIKLPGCLKSGISLLYPAVDEPQIRQHEPYANAVPKPCATIGDALSAIGRNDLAGRVRNPMIISPLPIGTVRRMPDVAGVIVGER